VRERIAEQTRLVTTAVNIPVVDVRSLQMSPRR
jgi:hypothetical protein